MQHEPLADVALPVAGVDVSKKQLDLFIDIVDQRLQVANDDAGVARLLAGLLGHKVRLVVVEATGRYHRRVAAALCRPASTWRWSILSRPAPSPKPRGSWRRPTASTPRYWPASGGR